MKKEKKHYLLCNWSTKFLKEARITRSEVPNFLLRGSLSCESAASRFPFRESLILRASIICRVTIGVRLISNNNRCKTNTKDSGAVLQKEKKFSICIALFSHHFIVSEGYLSKLHWRRFPGFLLPSLSVDSLTDRDEATEP